MYFPSSFKTVLCFLFVEESEDALSSSFCSVEENKGKNSLPLDRSNSLKGINLFLSFSCIFILSDVIFLIIGSHLFKGMPKSKEDVVNSQMLIRKEALKYVTNLCSSLSVKASEQGLLK